MKSYSASDYNMCKNIAWAMGEAWVGRSSALTIRAVPFAAFLKTVMSVFQEPQVFIRGRSSE